MNLLGFPRVADPHVVGRDRGVVTTSLHHIRGQSALLRLVLVLWGRKKQNVSMQAPMYMRVSREHTCRTKTKKLVFSPSRPSCFCACSTSFSSSRTAYSSVVRVSSTSSTMRMFLPIRLAISRELRSNHCVRVTLVPGTSSASPRPRSS